MAAGDVARLYHRLSAYAYDPDHPYDTPPIDDPWVIQEFVPYDADRLPPTCKVYPDGTPAIALPRTWPMIPTSATAVLAGRFEAPAAPLDLAALARLLHLSGGVTRIRASKPPFTDPWLFRAAGSAGGRSPFELYVSARDVAGLDDGVYWYDPIGHALLAVAPPADGEATTIIVTAVPWRTTWRYTERGFRHVYWDAGSVLAQTMVLGDSAGFGPRFWTRFPDADVAALVGADGVDEFPVALVGLGHGAPAIRPSGVALHGSIGEAPTEFPLVTHAQHAGDQTELGDPWPAAPALAGDVPDADDLDAVILRRGSARRMDATATVPRDVFEFSLASGLRGTTTPQFVAVHAVDGVEPGLYRWPDMSEPVRSGDLRKELLRACWDANLGRDAAFVVMSVVDLATIDDRGYREAQLDAGIVEGRLHLAAYALGIGASGMTFLDDEIEPLLGAPWAGLLFTCVGVPDYPGKAGGMPGEPVWIVTPPSGDTPRDAPSG